LEKSGVMDALTKVLVGLYEEPDRAHINALDYVKKYWGAPTGVDLDALRRENETLKKQMEKLKKQLALQEKDQQQGDNTKK
jgi:predicted ATP-grasp superfamily ATP-dependent carboligase